MKIKKLLLVVVLGLIMVSCNKENDKNEPTKKTLKDPKDMTTQEISDIVKNSTWEWVYNTEPFTSDFSSLDEGVVKNGFPKYMFPMMTSFFGFEISGKNYNTYIIDFTKDYAKVLFKKDEEMLEKFISVDFVYNGGRALTGNLTAVKENYYPTNFKDLNVYGHDDITHGRKYIIDGNEKKGFLGYKNKFSLQLNDSKTDYILINKGEPFIYQALDENLYEESFKALIIRLN